MKVDLKQVERFEDELMRFGRKGVPHAIRNTVNDLAFEARKRGVGYVTRHMVQRNTWTRRSIQVERADLSNLTSKMGSTQDYMEKQEEGFTKVSKGKHGAPIPTTTASGEPEHAVPRRKVVRRPNKLSRIKLSDARRKGRGRKQKNAIAISIAAKGRNNRYAYLNLGRRKGIFRVDGSRRNPDIKMVHDLTRKTIVVKRRPWFSRAVKAAIGMRGRIYVRRLEEQVDRAFRMTRRI